MSVVRAIWSGEKPTQRTLTIVAALVVVAGIVVIILGEVAGWSQTRLPGASLITIGGLLGGAVVGFSRPARARVWTRLMRWRVWIALVAATAITAPAMAAMASAALGPFTGGGDARNTGLVVVGALIGLIFLAGAFLAALVAVQATRERVGSMPEGTGESERPEESS